MSIGQSSDNMRTSMLVVHLLFSLLASLNVDQCDDRIDPDVVNIGFMLKKETDDENNYDRILPAVQAAIEDVNLIDLKDHPQSFKLKGRPITGACGLYTDAPYWASQLYYRENVTVYIGPICSTALSIVSHYAESVYRPLFTAGYEYWTGVRDHGHVGAKTLTEFGGSFEKVIDATAKFAAEYGWDNMCVVSSERFALHANYITTTIKQTWSVAYVEVDRLRDNMAYIRDILLNCSTHARVILLVLPITRIRLVMAVADIEGYANGEYVFLSPSPEAHKLLQWRGNDTHSEEARRGFRALMMVMPADVIPRQYRNLERRVVTRYAANTRDTSWMPYIAATFYDIIRIYAKVYIEIVANEKYTTQALLKHLWNRTFNGISGSIHINEYGERQMDFRVDDFDYDSGEFVAMYRLRSSTNYSREVLTNRSIDWIGDAPPPNEPECGYTHHKCLFGTRQVILLMVIACLFVPLSMGYIYSSRRLVKEKLATQMPWKVSIHELANYRYSQAAQELSDLTFRRGTVAAVPNSGLFSGTSGSSTMKIPYVKTAVIKGTLSVVRYCNIHKVELTRALIKELGMLYEFKHENVNRFVGACTEPNFVAVVFRYEAKGSLQDLLGRADFKLDWNFKLSLLQDLCQGLRYIHSSHLRSHGFLKSTKCLIDRRFVLKITQYGFEQFNIQKRRLAHIEEETDMEKYARMLWTAPELLHKFVKPYGTPEGDIYSLSIIIEEVMTDGEGPFADAIQDYSAKELIEHVMNDALPFRPHLPTVNYPPEIIELATRCWNEDPSARPDIEEVLVCIKKMNRKSQGKTLMEMMLERVERYASDLESIMEEKSGKWLEEKKKAEELLEQMLPKQISEQLKLGQPVVPETYKCVTVYFSDIVGFTRLCSLSRPLEVVDMLNDMYTSFDAVISLFNVYKVETIGDAYMVASGVPERNGNEHAREISNMALVLLAKSRSTKIRHKPDQTLQLRIGIHSGSVVTGVVGTKMPRYCLFGDTVNTASRMESYGDSMRIHISEDTKTILDLLGTFTVELRGDITVKGKGTMKTYWLTGSDISYMKIHDKVALGIAGTKITESSALHAISSHHSTILRKDPSSALTDRSAAERPHAPRGLLDNYLAF